MALFNRKKTADLPEVEKYYQAERRDRGGLAWLLALVSIAVVAGLIVSLFLAGRWAYDQVTKDDTPENVAVTNDQNAPSVDGGQNNSGQPVEGDQEVQPDTGASAGQPPATSETGDQNGSAPAPETSQPSTPATGSSDALPNTGPGNVVAAFAGASIAAGSVHYAWQRRKLNRSYTD